MPPRSTAAAPAYLLLGDEPFFRDAFREQVVAAIPAEAREYSIADEDLRVSALDEILERARTPSLLAGRQVFFIRNVKELFGRGNRAGDFPANLGRYLAAPPPETTLVFIADHIHVPADPRQIALEDKSRLQRIEETLGRLCETVACGRVSPAQAVELIGGVAARRGWPLRPDAAQLLIDLVDADLGVAARELEKLADYAGLTAPVAAPAAGMPREIDAAAVTLLVAGARQRSAVDLTRRIAQRNRAAALETLGTIWSSEGDAIAIPLVFQLSRFLKMALLAREKRARDRRQLYESLPVGLKPAGFAADTVLALAQNVKSETLMRGLERLQRVDVALRSSPLSPRWLLEEAVLAMVEPPAAGNGRRR